MRVHGGLSEFRERETLGLNHMPDPPIEARGKEKCRAVFATTHWSVVLQAGLESSVERSQALESLCGAYWYPLYAYIRRLGHPPHDAQDLTQAFFAYVLEKELIAKANPTTGHFRSFLLASLKRFMANEYRRQQAEKRGGNAQTISFDAESAESRYTEGLAGTEHPQAIYERAWAVAILDQAMKSLESEYAIARKELIFKELHVFLQGDRSGSTYARIATGLAMTEGAVKVAVHRLRQRYRELLRAAVANTVADPLDVDEELKELLLILSR